MIKVKRLVSKLLIFLVILNLSGFNQIALAEPANLAPELVINNPDRANVTLGNNYQLDGYIKDQNIGDQLSLKYSIKKMVLFFRIIIVKNFYQ